MNRRACPSDVSDEEWAFVAPYPTLMTEDAPQRKHPLLHPPQRKSREIFSISRLLVLPGGREKWVSVVGRYRAMSLKHAWILGLWAGATNANRQQTQNKRGNSFPCGFPRFRLRRALPTEAPWVFSATLS